jgi:cytochrome c biogenesis protein
LLEVFLGNKENEKKDIFESTWKFLASVKLAIFVLILLAGSSIIGTIVEQKAEPATNIALLAKFFGDSAAPTVYNIFAKMGFMDMYGSWWFTSFLAIFCVNLIVCSIDRIPRTWRVIQMPQKPMSDNGIKSLPIKKELTFNSSLNAAKDEFLNSMKASRYRVFEATEPDSVRLYSQKGKYARLAVYVVHLSIILIFLGAIVGVRFGFKGYLNLPEGRSSDTAYESPTQPIPLGFRIKCNWYDTLYYEGIDTPREFQSELVIIEDGREVMKKVIEVNDPLKYKGITFFQLQILQEEFMIFPARLPATDIQGT